MIVYSGGEHALLGSLGAITGRGSADLSILPDWLEHGIESSLRDTEDDVPLPSTHTVTSLQSAVPRSIASSNRDTPVVLTPTNPSPAGSYVRQGGNKGPWMDLDQFYADTNTEQEEEEDEESEDEDGEGSPSEESEEEEDTDEEASPDEDGGEQQPLRPSR